MCLRLNLKKGGGQEGIITRFQGAKGKRLTTNRHIKEGKMPTKFKNYRDMYEWAKNDPECFWDAAAKRAKADIYWFNP